VFEQQADKEFRELFAWRKFADMIRLRALETQERDYKRKKQAFICGLRIEVNSRLQNVLGSHAKMSVQIRIQHVNNCEKFASELCYMFLLRVRAAMYYRQQEDNKEPKKSVADMLGKGLVRTLPETVSDNRLIGGMQRNIAAVNQHVNVEHVRTAQGVNFLEDQQTIALYIAVHYPNISERRANELVTEIIQERKSQLRGFSAQTMGRWDARLDAEDRQGRGALGYAYHTYF
jgi:hypothetical protein